MFNFPFNSSPSLKKAQNAFIKLDKLWIKTHERVIEIQDELVKLESFHADPFGDIENFKNDLLSENVSYLPDLTLTKEDDSAAFSIAYNDIVMNAGSSAGDMSPVGWFRLYQKLVKESGDPLMYKAFYRCYHGFFKQDEYLQLEWHGGISFYEDYLTLCGDAETVKKWKDNLAALDHIDAMKKKHIAEYKHTAHQKQQNDAQIGLQVMV